MVYFVLYGGFLYPLGFKKLDNYNLAQKELKESSFGYMRLGSSIRPEKQHLFMCDSPAVQDLCQQ